MNRRLVIVTGKGGVGKTTLAAAMARAMARAGKRVLCAEVAAHPDTPSALVEALGGRRSSEEPTFAAKDIDTVLLTPTAGHRRFLQDTLPLKVLADAAMKSQGLKRFLSAAPGFSDMGVMYRALDLMNKKRPEGGFQWDVLLLDSPATGHALALAQIPAFLLKVIPHGPIGRVARDGLSILTDPSQTATVVVTLPETLPVTEALELSRGLQRHRLSVNAVIVNRVPQDPFSFDERLAVKGLIDGQESQGHQVFGARELHRIERAEAATALLSADTALPVLRLPELDSKGPELAEQLATRLSAPLS